jgi:hypothetical protein
MLPHISSFFAPSNVLMLGSSRLLPLGSDRITPFDLGSPSPSRVQAFWCFMFTLFSKINIRERSRVFGVSSSGLTCHSTLTLPIPPSSSSNHFDFFSPSNLVLAAAPVNSVR